MTDDRLLELLEAHLEGSLTPAEQGELSSLLRSSLLARKRYWAYVEQHALIQDVLSECRGMDLAFAETDALPAPAPIQIAPRRRCRTWAWAGALVAVAAALLIALGLWSRRGPGPDHPPPDAPAFAAVQSLSGDVRLDGAPAAVGSSVSVGQTLRVGDEEGRAEVVFADGTRLTLASGSALRFDAPQGQESKRLHLEAGAVQVDATAQAAGGDLVVTTDHARLTARGARFRVYREPRASRVEVERGKVRLEGDEATEVAEGSYAFVPDEPQPMLTRPLPVSHCRLRHTFLRAGDDVCFSRDGARVLASHFARGLKVWGAADGKLLSSAPGNGQRSDGLVLTQKADVAVVLGNGGSVTLWKVGEERPSQVRLREKNLRGGAVSADGRWLAQGTGDGEVALWEADPEKGTISHRRSLSIKPSRLALASVGPHVAVSRWGGEIHVFDVKTGRQVSQHKLRRTPTPLALSDDARVVAAYAITDGLALFDRQGDQRLTLWPGEGSRVRHLCFSRDGRVLLAGLDDGTVRAWSAADGRSLLVLDSGHRHVNKVAVNADLTLLATVGDNDCVQIWEIVLP